MARIDFGGIDLDGANIAPPHDALEIKVVIGQLVQDIMQVRGLVSESRLTR